MLTEKEKQVVLKYVDNYYYDQEKLISYLSMHELVGVEVFYYCDRHKSGDKNTFSRWLDYKDGYEPLPVSMFVKRIPFFFYVQDHNALDLKEYGDLENLHACCADDIRSNHDAFERLYTALEYMFYDLALPLNKIFSYWIDQTGVVSGNLFFRWEHYLRLCVALGKDDFFPERFITAYNEALEASGLPPIIYEIHDTGYYEAFTRDGCKLSFEGQFPCDEQGNPIMKWIGIHATNIKAISCYSKKSKSGYLTIEITPSTVIKVLNYYNSPDDTEDYWYPVYTGPLTMSFDHTILKNRRKELGYTQQAVADAVGTSVRTYQKWEAGNTIPDGYFLIRLLNWLDISNIQDVTEFIAI